MRTILVRAAVMGHAQLAAQSFADRRPDREVWPGTHWEWAVLRPENGTFDTPDYADVYARQKWFYQAQIESPAMFARTPGAGSLYWLATRDNSGAYLDGGKTYTLAVPQPVPAKLFWSITVYDARTRSEIRADQGKAAIRSLFELADLPADKPVRLHFGPDRPPPERRTAPGFRPSLTWAGSPTSGSTAPRDPPSMAPGSYLTSIPPDHYYPGACRTSTDGNLSRISCLTTRRCGCGQLSIQSGVALAAGSWVWKEQAQDSGSADSPCSR